MSIFYKGKQIAGNEVTLSEVKKQTEQGINELEYKKNSSLQDLENKRSSSLDVLSQKVEEAVGVAIGTYLDIASNSIYTPSGYLLRDGAEYSRTQFESFYDNWLTTSLYTLCGYMEIYSSTISKGFEAELTFKIGENITSEEGLIDYDGYHLLYIYNGKIKAYTSEAGDVEFGDAVVNTEFTAKLVCSDVITVTINNVTLTQSVDSGKITLMNNSIKKCSLLSLSLINGEALYANGKYNSVIGYSGSPTITEIGTTHVGANLKAYSYAEYNNQINNNGFCDKFAVDTTNKKFRVPLANPNTRTLIKKKEPTELDPTWYNLYSDGWCEQGGVTTPSASTANKEVFLNIEYRNTSYQVLIGNEYTASATSVACIITSTKTTTGFTIADAKNSAYYTYWRTQGYTDRIVEGSTRPYVVVANGKLNESDMNWSQWATSLEGKANSDLTNVTFTQTLKDKFISWNMPDYNSGIAVTFPVAGTEFIAPCDGIYVTNVYYNNRQSYLYINGIQAFMYYDHSDSIIQYPMYVPLQKGDTIYWSASLTNDFSIFYPLKGAN